MALIGYPFWICLYLLVGVAVFLLLQRFASAKTKPVTIREIWLETREAIVDMRRQRISWASFAEKALLRPLIILIWPISMSLFTYLLYQDRNSKPWEPDPEDAFTCHRKHLVAKVTPEAAELQARVVDPLGRVPDLPFGHLNGGWRALLDAVQVGDELWSFEVPGYAPSPEDSPTVHRWAMPRGSKRGYALVAGSKVRRDFVYEWD